MLIVGVPGVKRFICDLNFRHFFYATKWVIVSEIECDWQTALVPVQEMEKMQFPCFLF